MLLMMKVKLPVIIYGIKEKKFQKNGRMINIKILIDVKINNGLKLWNKHMIRRKYLIKNIIIIHILQMNMDGQLQ